MKNREEYNAYMKDYVLRRYHRRMAEARLKLGGSCVKCGSQEKLELDHIDPETKLGTVAKIWSCSEKKFQEELAKCQLLCQVCHIHKTIRDLKFQPNKGVHGTYGNYNKYGCRCVKCRAANAASARKYK